MNLDISDPDRPWMRHSAADEVDDNGLDYSWDWTEWLAAVSDSISAYTVTVHHPDGRATTPTLVAGVVTCFVAFDSGAVGSIVRVSCHIETAGGRDDQRSIWLKVMER